MKSFKRRLGHHGRWNRHWNRITECECWLRINQPASTGNAALIDGAITNDSVLIWFQSSEMTLQCNAAAWVVYCPFRISNDFLSIPAQRPVYDCDFFFLPYPQPLPPPPTTRRHLPLSFFFDRFSRSEGSGCPWKQEIKKKTRARKVWLLGVGGRWGKGGGGGKANPPPFPDPGGHNNIVCRSGKVQSNVMICVCVTFSFFLFLIISCPFPSPSSSSLCLLPPPLPLPPPPLEIWGCVSYWSVVV